MSDHGEKDTLQGKGKELGGKIQQAAGDLTDDPNLKAEGKANETEGKAQGFFGKVKDKVADAADAVKDTVNDVADHGKARAHDAENTTRRDY